MRNCVLMVLTSLSLTGTYIDKKCPFTGTVSIRGRILAGTCHSAKMNRTIIVRRNYLHFIKKYQRQENFHLYNSSWLMSATILLFSFSVHYLFLPAFLIPCLWANYHAGNSFRYEKRHSNIPAHISPCFRVKEGDHVIIGQCRCVF